MIDPPAAGILRIMSDLSFRLAQALSSGRLESGKPGSREEVLRRLLRKRAAAARAGSVEQEAALREQILWALPVYRDDGLSVSD